MLPRPPDPQSALTPLLTDGEELLWYDQPAPSAVQSSVWSSAIVGLVIISAAIAWTVMAVEESPVFVVVGFAFASVGLWLASAPIRQPIEARFIYYAITDKRLIVARLWPRKRVQSYAPADIKGINVQQADNGLSDVIFGKTIHIEKEYDGTDRQTSPRAVKRTKVDAFFGIRDGARVADAISNLKSGA
jgi:hypothetical protein